MTEFIFETFFGFREHRLIPTSKLTKFKHLQNGWIIKGQNVLKTPKSETITIPKYKWNLRLYFESQLID